MLWTSKYRINYVYILQEPKNRQEIEFLLTYL